MGANNFNAIDTLKNNLVDYNNTPTVQVDQLPGMVQSGTQYATAMQVIKQRNLQAVTNKCLIEANLAGEEFYYSWSQGGSIIEGLTVGAALAIVRNYGNCSVDVRIEETQDSYIFHGVFIDLETGFNMSRPFRQNKQSPKTRSGKDIYKGDRGKDIIFQIGASKAIRNVVLNACPNWLTKKVLTQAKANVSNNIKKMGKVAALTMLQKKSDRLKIPFENIERHYGKSASWDEDKLVMVSGALRSIEDGYETVDSIFPTGLNEKPTTPNSQNKNTQKPKSQPQNNNNSNPQDGNNNNQQDGTYFDPALEADLFQIPYGHEQ